MFIGRADVEMKLQYFGHLMQRADPLEKTLMLGKICLPQSTIVNLLEAQTWHEVQVVPGTRHRKECLWMFDNI